MPVRWPRRTWVWLQAALQKLHVFLRMFISSRPRRSRYHASVRRCTAHMRTIRRGVGFSLGYNALGIGLAVAGVLSPLVAAVLMPLSSLTVVTHAFRSRSFTVPRVERGEQRERPLHRRPACASGLCYGCFWLRLGHSSRSARRLDHTCLPHAPRRPGERRLIARPLLPVTSGPNDERSSDAREERKP